MKVIPRTLYSIVSHLLILYTKFKKGEEMKNIEKGLIVSVQALKGEPLHSSFIMGRMALAAEEGGAVGLRANTAEDILEIKKQTDLPVIGIVKQDYDDSDVYITPTLKEINELSQSGCEIVAMDATGSSRPGGVSLKNFYEEVRSRHPNLLLMADCSTHKQALYADRLGFDYIGTTLVGYTKESENHKIESNDFQILENIIKDVKAPVIAEGNINTPQKAKRVLELGAHTVVVGSMITRPQIITKTFVDEIKKL